jgi:hypothetical protein
MAARLPLINFSKGEISAELYARTDVTAYNAGLKRARNVCILKYGGVTKRPGTRFIAPAYDQDLTRPERLMPFQFNDSQSYALEFGQAFMRPTALGGLVLEGALTITAITRAAQAAISCAFHGYAVGDQVFFSGVQGMTEINGRIGTVVSVPDANSYVVDIDTSDFAAFTGDMGGAANTEPPPPPDPAPVVPDPVPDPDPPVVGGGGRRLPNQVLP